MKITEARARTNKAWRQRNREHMRALGRTEYERRREWYLWKARLATLLARVVRAAEKKDRDRKT